MANNTKHTAYMKSRELSSPDEGTSILCSGLKQTRHWETLLVIDCTAQQASGLQMK